MEYYPVYTSLDIIDDKFNNNHSILFKSCSTEHFDIFFKENDMVEINTKKRRFKKIEISNEIFTLSKIKNMSKDQLDQQLEIYLTFQ